MICNGDEKMFQLYNGIRAKVTDNEATRYERLHIVIGYLYAMDKFSVDMIERIEDEEGCLIINWIIQPLPSTIKNCQDVWSSPLCNEAPENIKHYVNGEIFKI